MKQQHLISLANQLGLSLNQVMAEKLIGYIQLLVKWNRSYNLTAIDDPEQMLVEHILDSLSIAPYLSGENILDVGTGAGLPGIPLAIYYPHKQFVLLDSNGKKIRFLIQVIAELRLENARSVQARAEEYRSSHCFDCITSRAFSAVADMLIKTEHLCCPRGKWLAMKGRDPAAEVVGMSYPHQLIELTVPNLAKQRHLLIITKP